MYLILKQNAHLLHPTWKSIRNLVFITYQIIPMTCTCTCILQSIWSSSVLRDLSLLHNKKVWNILQRTIFYKFHANTVKFKLIIHVGRIANIERTMKTVSFIAKKNSQNKYPIPESNISIKRAIFLNHHNSSKFILTRKHMSLPLVCLHCRYAGPWLAAPEHEHGIPEGSTLQPLEGFQLIK